MPAVMQLRRQYDKQNREAAEIIAAQPEKYRGLLATWARGILEKCERGEAQPRRLIQRQGDSNGEDAHHRHALQG